MEVVDLREVEEGMVLGSDVLGANGQPLLRAGISLTRRHLQLLSANGVTHVSVRTAAAIPGDAPEPLNLEAVVQERFRNTDPDHPLIRELQRLCRQRLEERLGDHGHDR